MVDFAKLLLQKRQKETPPNPDAARVEIYTDGACQPNPGPGGWAFLVRELDTDSILVERCEGETRTTNNRMELQAIIQALQWVQVTLPPGSKVTVFSDSQLCIRAFQEWIFSWQQQGWRRANGELLNVDLWKLAYQILMDLQLKQDVFPRFQWVKGHAGNPHNERVDRLAVNAAQVAREKIPVDSPLVNTRSAFRNFVTAAQGLGDSTILANLTAIDKRLSELEAYLG